MTVQDGGKLLINEMIDKYGQAIDDIYFTLMDFRTGGFATIQNGMKSRNLFGQIFNVNLIVIYKILLSIICHICLHLQLLLYMAIRLFENTCSVIH